MLIEGGGGAVPTKAKQLNHMINEEKESGRAQKCMEVPRSN